jgi:hypothetical protein
VVHAGAGTGYIVAARHVIRRGVRSDMAIFNDGSAGIAVAQLADLGGGKLRDCRYEIQEGGDFLRLSAELTVELDDGLRERIKSGLSRALPKRKGAYPWMVVLTRQGSLVESIFPDMIL